MPRPRDIAHEQKAHTYPDCSFDLAIPSGCVSTALEPGPFGGISDLIACSVLEEACSCLNGRSVTGVTISSAE